jgi:hypothetical protein
VAQSLNRNWLDNQKKIQYLEERIIIGWKRTLPSLG